MAEGTLMLLRLDLLLVSALVTCMTASDQRNITAASGQNINISCEVSDEKSIITVEWRRAEDADDEHVIVYRNGKISSEDQLKQFKGRVNLTIQERSLTLILKNVTTNDSGTFQCRVQRPGSGGMEHVCTRNLEVSPPAGNPDGNRNDGVKQDGSDGPISDISDISDKARTGIIAAAVVVAAVVVSAVVAAAAVVVAAAAVVVAVVAAAAVVVIKIIKKSSDPSQTSPGAAVDESSQQIEMDLMSDHQISDHPEASAAQRSD